MSPSATAHQNLVLRAHDLCKTFEQRRKKGVRSPAAPVFTIATLELRRNEKLAIVGPSGSGKTTLLRVLAKLIEPDAGGEVDHSTAPNLGQTATAFVFQDMRLLPWRTALENVELGLEFQKVGKQYSQARKDIEERARGALNRLGLKEHENKYPHELSTGMQQRVGLARALVLEPVLVFLDEPLSSVDAINRERLQNLVVTEISQRSAVIVTHDIEEAIVLGDKVAILAGQPASLRGQRDGAFWNTAAFGTENRLSNGFRTLYTEIHSALFNIMEEESP